MTAFSFSYAPKASTALASINPIQNRGEGLRFAANTPMSFTKQNPEIVAEGFWKGRQALTEGISKGVLSAIGSVSGAFTQKAADAKADKKLTDDRAHEIKIAEIKAAPTAAETAYQQQRSDLLTEQIAAAKAKNENVTATESTGSLVPREVDFFSDLESIPDFGKQPVENPAPVGTPAVDATGTPASTGTPAGTTFVPNPQTPAQNTIISLQRSQQQAENAKKQLAQSAATSVKFETEKALKENNFDELDRLASLGAIDKDILNQYKTFQNSVQRSTDRLAKLQSPNTAIAENPEPAPPAVSRFAPADAGRELFQFDRPSASAPSVAAATTAPDIFSNINLPESVSSVASANPNIFSNINLPTSVAESQLYPNGFPISKASAPRNLPEEVGKATLQGVTLPLVPVSGAEDKPLSKTPPPVEPALPEKVPAQPLEAKAVPFTQEQVRYYLEDKYTSRPYQSPADANMAKKLLEQKLGVTVEIDTEKGEKGTRLYHVRIVGDAPPPKTAPEGFYIKKIKDADGKETYEYEPKIPVKQQIATFDNNIDKAKVLKKTLEKIEKIAPGYLFAGAGGISGLMKYNPIANDARTTRSLLDTVKGIVGFDELVALKAQGGTLGALSDKELDMLTSLKGSINPDMDEATFLENIKSMRESTDRLIAGLEDDKKQVTKVENKTNFQPIQSQKTNKKGDSFIFEGNRYVHDGTKFVLTK